MGGLGLQAPDPEAYLERPTVSVSETLRPASTLMMSLPLGTNAPFRNGLMAVMLCLSKRLFTESLILLRWSADPFFSV